MKRTARIALAALLMVAAACHKTVSKDEQLKALDEAYKSGVFTKEEYDAKKQALTGTPAAASTPAPAAAVAPAPAPPPAQAGAVEPTVAPSDTAPPSAAVPAPAPAPQRRAAAPPVQTQSAPPPAPAAALPPPTPAPAPVPAPPPQPRVAPPAPAPSASAPPAESEPAPLAGCQDAESRAGGPNGAQQRFFPASEDAVRRAALEAFAKLDFVVHDSTAHDMEASKKGKLNSVVGAGTERVILHFSNVRQNGQTGTRVVGDTKRGFMGRVTQKSWTSAVLSQISCYLRGGQ